MPTAVAKSMTAMAAGAHISRALSENLCQNHLDVVSPGGHPDAVGIGVISGSKLFGGIIPPPHLHHDLPGAEVGAVHLVLSRRGEGPCSGANPIGSRLVAVERSCGQRPRAPDKAPASAALTNSRFTDTMWAMSRARAPAPRSTTRPMATKTATAPESSLKNVCLTRFISRLSSLLVIHTSW